MMKPAVSPCGAALATLRSTAKALGGKGLKS